MSTDLRVIIRAGGIALASFAALITGLIQQDEVNGVGWVIASGACGIGAVFLGDIAGGIAGAVRTALARPSGVERAALLAKVDTKRLRRVVPWLAEQSESEKEPDTADRIIERKGSRRE